ncbi:MAG: bifunctional oligoribonuclease/PAP phosphatase NrnA [Candidatus Omnitrophota bacterium]
MTDKEVTTILSKVNELNNFLIMAHINPEGDSIGSQLGLADLLRQQGKKYRIINDDPVPKNLMFLPGAEKIEEFGKIKDQNFNIYDFDAAIILDCPVLERIGKIKEKLENLMIINIDHHFSNQAYGDINWIQTQASSAGEMVYEMFQSSKAKIDRQTAVCLYTAIMTDTGSFRYTNTTIKTHLIIAELLKLNVNPTLIYEYVYETKSFAALKLLAQVLLNMQRSADGKFIWFKVTNQMLLEHNLTQEATEDFINFVRMVEGTEVVAFLRELAQPNVTKVSLRSKKNIDVNSIARVFSGGGHKAASGCIINENIQKAEKLLIKEWEKIFKSRLGE